MNAVERKLCVYNEQCWDYIFIQRRFFLSSLTCIHCLKMEDLPFYIIYINVFITLFGSSCVNIFVNIVFQIFFFFFFACPGIVEWRNSNWRRRTEDLKIVMVVSKWNFLQE